MTNIVLDLGGVLIDWDPRHLYRKLLPDENAVEEFLARVCTMDWNERQDAGRTFAEGVAELVAQFPAEEALIRAYWDRWPEMVTGAFDDTVALLGELCAVHPTYALSNWSMETWAFTQPQFEFLGWFRGIVLSGQEGVAKPDERIYRILLDRYALDPAETIFIDDNPRNVAVAQRLGIDGIVHTGVPALRRELVARGVL